ncbi:hypothetical protein BH23CHL7_BH23CHL7_04040 [soil metagenome]
MESLQWLWTECVYDAAGEATNAPCTDNLVLTYLYLVAMVVGAVLFYIAARRSRDLSTSVLALMPVAIAINIAVGAIVAALRLPIYLDSIGTVLVGVLAGPWAGALTGLLTNLIWALLPIPGGAGPIIAFFAPVAAVIGLMAGFWGSRGVFQLRADDGRVGGFLALAAGVAAAGVAFLLLQFIVGLPDLDTPEGGTLFVTEALAIVGIGVLVAWASARSVFRLPDGDPRIRSYLAVATGAAAGVLAFALLRLVFGEGGWLASLDGSAESGLPGTNLSGLTWADPIGLYAQLILAVVLGAGAWYWASRGGNARLFPIWIGGLTTGLVAAAMSAPISAGVFGGVTGSGQDLLVSLYRTLGLNVFQSAFAQGLTSDPLDKTISYTVVFLILAALPITVRTMFSHGEAAVADN